MTRGTSFQNRGKCRNGHCSKLSESAWSDLNKNGTILKLHDMCPNQNCKCQKQITFTPKQFQLEGSGFKSFMKKVFKGSKTAWDKFLKPAVNATAPVIGAAIAAKTKNPKAGQTTAQILKAISGGKILTLTDNYSGSGVRLGVMPRH